MLFITKYNLTLCFSKRYKTYGTGDMKCLLQMKTVNVFITFKQQSIQHYVQNTYVEKN